MGALSRVRIRGVRAHTLKEVAVHFLARLLRDQHRDERQGGRCKEEDAIMRLTLINTTTTTTSPPPSPSEREQGKVLVHDNTIHIVRVYETVCDDGVATPSVLLFLAASLHHPFLTVPNILGDGNTLFVSRDTHSSAAASASALRPTTNHIHQ